MTSIYGRLKDIDPITTTRGGRTILSDTTIGQITEQFRKSGYIDSIAFMAEFEKQLSNLDLSPLRISHDHQSDLWAKEAVLETVKRSMKDA